MKPSPIRVISRGVFVPEWGNGAREPKDKITIHHRFLTFAEQQELLHYDDMAVNFAYESRLVAKMIDRIDNCSVQDESNKIRQIKTGEDLVNEPVLDKLALETWMHFRNISALDEEDKKKLPSESSSGSKAKTKPVKESSPETDG